MDYRKLLGNQISKSISDITLQNPEIQKFLKDIEGTYLSFEKEKELLTRAYKLAENEFIEITNNLNNEVRNRKETIQYLKSALQNFNTSNDEFISDDLFDFSTIIVEEINKRQKAEDTIKSLINNLNLGILLKDTYGNIIYSNRVVFKLFDVKKDNDENSIDLLLEKISFVRNKHSNEVRSTLGNGLEDNVFFTEIWKIDTDFFIEETKIPYLYGNNNRGYIFTYADVTKREKSNELIRKSELRNNQILNGSPDSVILIDENGTIKFANERTCEVFGWNRNEIIDKDVRFLLPFEGMLTVENKLNQNIRFDKELLNKNIEQKIVNRFGIEIWIEFSIIIMEKMNDASFCCFIRDITSRKLAENEITIQKKFTEDILNNIPNDIAVLDVNQNYLFVNQSSVNNSEIRNWLIGKNDFDYCKLKSIDVTLAKKRENAFLEAINNNKDVEWIDELMNKNGKIQYFQRKFHPFTEDEKIKFVIGYGFDITNNISTQKELEQSLEYVQKINNELEQFAYVASHDLQEPLRTITNFLYLIDKKISDNLDEKTKSYINFAIDAAKKMRLLIIDLLEYSRIGKTSDEQLELVDLNVLISEIKILHHKQIEELSANIVFQNLPFINVHQSLIRQVFQNFINNSLKYHRENVAPIINISAKDLKTHWQFSISDNGIGIDKAYHEKIFQIFQRLHNRLKYEGSGIGLTISKKIIEIMNGRIWLESEEGVGTTFYFTIEKK